VFRKPVTHVFACARIEFTRCDTRSSRCRCMQNGTGNQSTANDGIHRANWDMCFVIFFSQIALITADSRIHCSYLITHSVFSDLKFSLNSHPQCSRSFARWQFIRDDSHHHSIGAKIPVPKSSQTVGDLARNKSYNWVSRSIPRIFSWAYFATGRFHVL